jgi:hypothetical protein
MNREEVDKLLHKGGIVIARQDIILSARLLLSKAPPFVTSLVVAEMFFKFGSFTRECLAFLALWYALDWVYQRALDVKKPYGMGVARRRPRHPTRAPGYGSQEERDIATATRRSQKFSVLRAPS